MLNNGKVKSLKNMKSLFKQINYIMNYDDNEEFNENNKHGLLSLIFSTLENETFQNSNKMFYKLLEIFIYCIGDEINKCEHCIENLRLGKKIFENLIDFVDHKISEFNKKSH